MPMGGLLRLRQQRFLTQTLPHDEKMGGIYCGETTCIRGDKEYVEVGYIYDLESQLELVFPTKEYKKQVEEYLQEFFDNGELEIAGDGGLDRIKDFDKWLQKVQNDLSEDNIEDNRIPATLYLTIRKSDKKIVGNQSYYLYFYVIILIIWV